MCIDDEENYKPINLSLEVDYETDQTLYNRLIEIPEEKRIEHVLSWMRIGEIASNLIIAQTSDRAIESYFSPILLSMEELRNKIDSLKGDFKSSIEIGQLGEEILKGQFQNYFSTQGDSFEVVSENPHQADIHATIQVKRDDEGFESIPVLIEAKFYSNAVPNKEVEKFWDDLDREVQFKAGIFVSLSSDIVGKKGPINIDVVNGKLAIFIANKGTDQLLHIVAWALLREMLRVQIQKNIDTQAFKRFDIERIAQIIKRKMEDIESQLEKLDDIEKNAQKIIPAISNIIAQIHNSAGSLREGIDTSLLALNKEFNREIAELVPGEKPELPGWKQDNWNLLTQTADDKHNTILEVTRVQLSNYQDTFTLKQGENENEIIGCIEDNTCFKISWISNKVRIAFSPIDQLDFSKHVCDTAKIDKDNWLVLEGKAKKNDLGDFNSELLRELLSQVVKK